MSQPSVIVMRHSKRLDNAPGVWPDKATRPYDTPIRDAELPLAVLAEIQAQRPSRVIRFIAASPFRRTLQTAGILARALNIATVYVHSGLGEHMREVQRSFKHCKAEADRQLVYLDQAGMQEALGLGVSPVVLCSTVPSVHQNTSRVSDTLDELHRSFSLEAGCTLLAVSHGFAVGAALWRTGFTIDQCPECCYVEVAKGKEETLTQCTLMGGGLTTKTSTNVAAAAAAATAAAATPSPAAAAAAVAAATAVPAAAAAAAAGGAATTQGAGASPGQGWEASPASASELDTWRAARHALVKLAGGATVWETPEQASARGATVLQGTPGEGSCRVALPYVSLNMEAWGGGCGQACCFVDNCGKEACSGGCGTMLHVPGAPVQPVHFACLGPQCSEVSGLGLLCSACLASPALLHEHELFVRVQGSQHAVVRRTVGLALRRQLQLGDVAVQQAPACAVCYEEFSATVRPGALPGCPKAHTGVPGAPLVCAQCVVLSANANGGLLYPASAGAGAAGASVSCKECAMEAQAVAFAQEARAARVAASAVFAAFQPDAAQAWRQAVRAASSALSLDAAGMESITAVGADGPTGWGALLEALVARWKQLHPQPHIQKAGELAWRAEV